MPDNIIEIPGAKERLEEIRNEVIGVAKTLARQVRKAYPSKRIFPVRDGKECLRRQERESARAALLFSAWMGASQIMTILSRPIPRQGTDRIYPAGIAVVGEERPKEIVYLGEQIWHIPNAFPTPPGFR